MSIKIKIHQGTGRLTGDNLCRSCVNANFQVDSKGEKFNCSANTLRMQPRGIVSSCRYYSNASLTSLDAMEGTAWILRPHKDGKTVGFMPPKPRTYDDDD